MKPEKIIYVLCLVFLLNNYQVLNIFAQEKEPTTVKKNVTVESATKLPAENVAALDKQTTPDKSFFADNSSNEKYVIGFQDTLEIQIFKHQELSQMVNVSPDGTILMPRINQPILAACKTERELRDNITTLYKSYLRNPFVSVRVVEQKSQPIGVIGAVEKPGNFFLNRKVRLLELLTLAGGQDVEFAGGKIKVARLGNSAGCGVYLDATAKVADNKIEFFEYKMNDVMEGKQNPWMEPGDIVSISVADEAYVVGNVVEPKKVSLRETVTLTKAIAMAGGLAKEAKTSRVRIQRQGKEGDLQTETFYDLKDIQSKKVPDPILQANDIVDVPNDSIKSIRNGILKAITGGIPNIFYKFP
jgi:polysaccharide export outer membrane protein